ncbi:hypothetical protein FH972_025128 [Carpinus fangiana]|uniref:MalT-like TPR region domain-containing protein n=1 Tax=Carpinus fangiana TaxID=176857 RepID=A0A5N6L0F7_9ROSI|nr:hypothetical protein FH972_025128 [Carpinus fangiana]
MLTTALWLGALYRDQRKSFEAEKFLNRAENGFREALGSDNQLTLVVMESLGNLYVLLAKYAPAENIMKAIIEAHDDGSEPVKVLKVHAMSRLAQIYQEINEPSKAKETVALVKRNMHLLRRLHSFSLYEVTIYMIQILASQGQLLEVEQLLLETMEYCKRKEGPNHHWWLRMIFQLGEVYRNQSKVDEAEMMYL